MKISYFYIIGIFAIPGNLLMFAVLPFRLVLDRDATDGAQPALHG
jgi:hypothetical protein